MKEESFKVESGKIQIPVLVVQKDVMEPEPSKAVFLFHGLSANKETSLPELRLLAEAGFLAIGVDAPDHGERHSHRLVELKNSPEPQRHNLFLRMVRQGAQEIPDLINFFRRRKVKSFGLIGISMGGFIAFSGVLNSVRPDACIPLLASPNWHGKGALPKSLKGLSPHLVPEKFPPVALMMINSGLDEVVPPHDTRDFAERLKPFYANCPEKLRYLEFPKSGHFMREEDWKNSWSEVIAWLIRFL